MGICGYLAMGRMVISVCGVNPMVESVCSSCGATNRVPEEVLGEQAIAVCPECGWVFVWTLGGFRAPTALELDLLGSILPTLLDVARGSIARQKRIMAGTNAS